MSPACSRGLSNLWPKNIRKKIVENLNNVKKVQVSFQENMRNLKKVAEKEQEENLKHRGNI